MSTENGVPVKDPGQWLKLEYEQLVVKRVTNRLKGLSKWFNNILDCPWCGYIFETNCEYVDVGVGGPGVQCTPNVCPYCGAVERGGYDNSTGIPERDGWFKGEDIIWPYTAG